MHEKKKKKKKKKNEKSTIIAPITLKKGYFKLWVQQFCDGQEPVSDDQALYINPKAKFSQQPTDNQENKGIMGIKIIITVKYNKQQEMDL